MFKAYCLARIQYFKPKPSKPYYVIMAIQPLYSLMWFDSPITVNYIQYFNFRSDPHPSTQWFQEEISRGSPNDISHFLLSSADVILCCVRMYVFYMISTISLGIGKIINNGTRPAMLCNSQCNLKNTTQDINYYKVQNSLPSKR